MKDQNNKSRPLILEIEDAKERITKSVNQALNNGLPCYILKDILENILSQVREGAKMELDIARSHEKKKEESKNGS